VCAAVSCAPATSETPETLVADCAYLFDPVDETSSAAQVSSACACAAETLATDLLPKDYSDLAKHTALIRQSTQDALQGMMEDLSEYGGTGASSAADMLPSEEGLSAFETLSRAYAPCAQQRGIAFELPTDEPLIPSLDDELQAVCAALLTENRTPEFLSNYTNDEIDGGCSCYAFVAYNSWEPKKSESGRAEMKRMIETVRHAKTASTGNLGEYLATATGLPAYDRETLQGLRRVVTNCLD